MKLKFSIKLPWLILIFAVLGCTDATTELPAPQKIGNKERIRAISGNQAANVINRMHNQSVAADANVIVEYGKEKKDILYISYYEDQNRAGEAFDLMIEKMASAKDGPFSHLMPLAAYENRVYFTLGMGAGHYIFISGKFLLWFQTYQSFGDRLPAMLLELYPV